MSTWQEYLTERNNQLMIKSSIPQLLEMGVDPIGFYKDVLDGCDIKKALNENPMPIQQPAQQNQNPNAIIRLPDNQIPNNPIGIINVINNYMNKFKNQQNDQNLKNAKLELQKLAQKQAQQPKQVQPNQPVQQQPAQAPMPNQPVR